MSNIVTSLLRSRKLGVGLTGKAILLLMGDLASDDGCGIWAAKSRMARELETTERTIQRTIIQLKEAGFLSEEGQKRHRNGYTIQYQIDVKRIEMCAKSSPEPPTERQGSTQDVGGDTQHVTPDTPSPPTHRHPTPDSVSPQDPTVCHPNPIGTKGNQSKDPPVVPQNSETPLSILSPIAGQEASASYIAYRRKLRKPMTVTAAKRLVSQLEDIEARGGSPPDALGMAEEKGWQSIKADWYFREVANDRQQRSAGPGPSNRPADGHRAMFEGFGAFAADGQGQDDGRR